MQRIFTLIKFKATTLRQIVYYKAVRCSLSSTAQDGTPPENYGDADHLDMSRLSVMLTTGLTEVVT